MEKNIKKGNRIHKPKFRCRICQKSFSTKAKASTHTKAHIPERQFFCKKCGIVVLSKITLLQHMQTHSDATFNCSECDAKFKNNKDLEKHIKTVHTYGTRKKCTCGICAANFPTRQQKMIHMKIHEEAQRQSGKLILPNCSYTEAQQNRLEVNELQTIQNSQISNQPNNINEDRYKCYFCNKTFIVEQELQMHIHVHTRETFEYNCESSCKKSRIDRLDESQAGKYRNKKCDDFPHTSTNSKNKHYDLPNHNLVFVDASYPHATKTRNYQPPPLNENHQFEVPMNNGNCNNAQPPNALEPVNPHGIRFYRNNPTDRQILFQDLEENHDTSRYYQIYLVCWGPPGDITKGVYIGYTRVEDVRETAQKNWSNILRGREYVCSVRKAYRQNGWTPRTNEAIATGIFSSDRKTIEDLKSFVRRRLLFLGTLSLHESLTRLHPHAQRLEDVIHVIQHLLPITTREWIATSTEQMNTFINNPYEIFPSLNGRMTNNHTLWTCDTDYGNHEQENPPE